jgi:PD-(D/E)XK nuclease superfamily
LPNIITPVYGGRATVTFNVAKHIYTVAVPEKGVTDLWQPSVTGVIRMMSKADVLMKWAVDQVIDQAKVTFKDDASYSRDIIHAVLDASSKAYISRRDNAGTIGTYVHDFLEAELRHRSGMGDPAVLPSDVPSEFFPSVKKSIGAGLKFFDEHKITLVQAEEPRWSPTYGFIGTMDAIAYVDGKLTVLDYKTSKRLYDTVFLQLAAYQMAYQEEYPDQQIEQRLGINVCRDGSLITKSRDNLTYKSDVDCFLALLTAWRWDRVNQGEFESKPVPAVVGQLN